MFMNKMMDMAMPMPMFFALICSLPELHGMDRLPVRPAHRAGSACLSSDGKREAMSFPLFYMEKEGSH